MLKKYLFIDQEIEQLKQDIYGDKLKLFQRLTEQCKRYEMLELTKEHPPTSTTYMGLAIANLSLAYILTEQEHYYKEAMRFINQVVDYEHWGNAHLVDVDLSAAFILFGVSVAYDWLKDRWVDEERIKIENKILLQCRRMYSFMIETRGTGWSTNYWQNHNWINFTGMAMAGYALSSLGEEPEAWVLSAKENFSVVFDGLAEDGSDYEGVVYWRYGVMWLFVYAHLLKEREGIDYFKKSQFLENTFFYRLYQAAPNLEEQINFGDCHDRRSGHSTAIYFKVASEYKNEYANYLGNLVVDKFLYREAYESMVKPGILPECFFELLFYNSKVKSKNFEDLPLVKYFEDLGLVVIRDSWRLDALHLSFKCGAPGGKKQWERLWELKNTKNYDCFGLSHQHPDNNSFILHYNNEYLAIDDGYNRSVKASDHNMILVDGKGFEGEEKNNVFKDYLPHMIGEIEKFKEYEDFVYIVGETSKTYQTDLKLTKCKRHIIYVKQGYIVIYDEIKSDIPHEYTWVMHSDTHPNECMGNNGLLPYFIYENGQASMKNFHWASKPTKSNQFVNKVRAIMTTQEPDKFREIKMKTVHLTSLEKSKDIEFINILMPYKTNLKEKVEAYNIDTKEYNGVKITKDDITTHFLILKKRKIEVDGKVIHGEKVVITYKGKKLLKVVVIDE